MVSRPFRKEKIEEQILHQINHFLRSEVKDPRLQFVSITQVKLTPDLGYAQVFWDTFQSQTRGDAKRGLESVTGKLKHLLSKTLPLRKVPGITLVYDAQFDSQQEIEKLLDANPLPPSSQDDGDGNEDPGQVS